MFSHEGTSRSDRQNRLLAGYLAFVGGFANACGLVLIGVFTSHVTGNVGRLASALASSHYDAALSTLGVVVAFFGGAFTVSVILESRAVGHVSRAYATALGVEAAALVGFTAVLDPSARGPHALAAAAALLSVAMGIQNGLVTRLSGAVVRTTHLTGVVTDLGIETARWFRFWRQALAARARIPLVVGPNPAERPPPAKVLLLGTIAASFVVGSVAGAFSALSVGRAAMLLPAAAVASCALYAIVNGRSHEASAASRR